MKIKYLLNKLVNQSGRNSFGHKTVKSKGKRVKRKLRLVNHYRRPSDLLYVIIKLHYDPSRSAYIALICYENGALSYIIATENVGNGSIRGGLMDMRPGNVQYLKNIPLGSVISNLEISINCGAKYIRAAGSYGLLLAHDLVNQMVELKLPSGEIRKVPWNFLAVIGRNSNIKHKNKCINKAGTNIYLGKAPIVRGVAKNSVDHPHGGGRGHTSKLTLPVNFTGRVKKGVKTRKKKLNYI